MKARRGRLVSGGRLQVPADFRRALGLADGDTVTMRVIDGELHLRPMRDAIGRVRARLRMHLPDGTRLADELIADRRAAAIDK